MKREASAQKVQGVDDESQAKLKDEETAGFTLFGEEQEVQCAYEPSNIIWENLEIPVKTRNRNKCRVLLIICFMLLIILLAVASLKVWATNYALKYPKAYECEQYTTQFTKNGVLDQAAYRDQAINDDGKSIDD